jgi:uroporphyrinogen III methyltransferase/synthase
MKSGKVFLIGAGPGDPGLITLKGIKLIEVAEVLVYDQLGTAAFVGRCKPECEMIDVGKHAGRHTVPQEKINEILIEKAREGKNVVRLKGGDPFVFGRGGEEIQKLHQAGVDFEVIPGITSAISAPAYAGIPVTHRDFTSTFAVITGHEADKENSAIDWHAVSRIGTLVFLMGVKKLPEIVRNLIKAGRDPETPVAMVQHGTLPIQKTLEATLETIVEIADKAGIKAPAVTIVGDVVNLRNEMKWFENRPLFGKNILVTRSRHQASELVAKLAELGANAIEFPTIKIVQHGVGANFKEFINQIDEYKYLVFTSVNGVEGFVNALLKSGLDLRTLHNKKIVCIGPATAAALLQKGIKADFVPETYVAEAIIPWFKDKKPAKIAFLRAEKAREILPAALRDFGYDVNVIAIYHTEFENQHGEQVLNMLKNGQIDLVTFTSSSTVEGFAQIAQQNNISPETVNGAVIGPITGKTAEEKGYSIRCRAREYTIPGLIDAIMTCFNQNT